MTLEIAIVYALLIGALLVFSTDRFPIDFVAFTIMAVVMILGPIIHLSPEDAISGFSNPATITVMAMFVLSGAVFRTGAINRLADRTIGLAGTSHTRQLLVIMGIVALVSMFINNTAAVAIFIPLVLTMARVRDRAPSKLLMPLSFGAQLAGVITVIGTSTNILASSLLDDTEYGGFGMFEFANIGLAVLAIGFAYLLTAGRALLPARRTDAEARESYRVEEYTSEVVIQEGSPLVGRTLVQSRLSAKYDVHVLEVWRNEQRLGLLMGERHLRSGDVLVIRADRQQLLGISQSVGLEIGVTATEQEPPERGELGLLEVVIGPNSDLIGGTLEGTNFRNRFNCTVIAMQKHGHLIQRRLGQQRLGFGDTLLLQGDVGALAQVKRERGFIITETAADEVFRPEKIPAALAIILGVVVVAALGIQPILVTSVVGCVLMVVTGCMTSPGAAPVDSLGRHLPAGGRDSAGTGHGKHGRCGVHGRPMRYAWPTAAARCSC